MPSFSDSGSWYAEGLKLRLMLGAIILFIVSTVACCNESRYMLWGQTVAAKFETAEAYAKRGRYGSSTPMLTVRYSFADGELGTRKEEDDVSETWLQGHQDVLPGGGVVNVQYLPGTLERSRLVGHDSKWLTIPFFLSLAAIAFFGVRFWVEFKDHERRSKATSELYRR